MGIIKTEFYADFDPMTRLPKTFNQKKLDVREFSFTKIKDEKTQLLVFGATF